MNTITVKSSSEVREPSPYHWTVEALYRAIDAGVFDHPERLELIRGELIEKLGQNPAHSSLIDILTRRLRARLEPRFTVREEKPLHIADDGEPVPDIMVVTGDAADYIDRHPSPADVVLLLEVADSSSAYDTRDKALLYAQAGISEYWVVSLPTKSLHVYRAPSPDGYESIAQLAGSQEITLAGAPDVTFSTEWIFEK